MSEAAAEALRELGPDVRAYLRAALRSDDRAGDAFSLFEEHLWRGLPSFRWSVPLRVWGFRIAAHAAIDVRRDRWLRRSRRLGDSDVLVAEDLDAASEERRLDDLDAARAALSLEDRSLLFLRADRGLAWAEIARVFAASGRGLTMAALMKRYERLKSRLARQLRSDR